jgi:hypothetical protein
VERADEFGADSFGGLNEKVMPMSALKTENVQVRRETAGR